MRRPAGGHQKGNCWSSGKPDHMQQDYLELEKQLSPQPSNHQQGNGHGPVARH